WRVVCEDEYRPVPSAAVYAIDPVEPLRCNLVPPPSCEDRSRGLHNLFATELFSRRMSGTLSPLSLHCLITQSIASSGPAMNPSRDIDACQITSPTNSDLHVGVGLGARPSRRGTRMFQLGDLAHRQRVPDTRLIISLGHPVVLNAATERPAH